MKLVGILKKGGVAITISFFVGIAVFFYFLFKLGPNTLRIIEKTNFFYIFLFFLLAFLIFVLNTLKFKFIIEVYKKKIPFSVLFRQMIAGYAVSYITPSARFGGEPVRVYMLKKEAGVDYKTASASVLLDKFVEVLGLIVFGIFGAILFVFSPGIAFSLKVFVVSVLIIVLLLVLFFYFRSIARKGSFSSLLSIFRLHKHHKFKDIFYFLEDVEDKIAHFFLEHKIDFIKSFSLSILYFILVIIQNKFLLLGLGFDISLVTIVISLTFLVVAEIIPVPAALGFLEAGQAAVFSLFSKGGSLGFAVSVFLRLSSFIFVALGFAFLSHFGWKRLEKLLKKVFK